MQIPATSAASERFFSQGALIISNKRNRISKETFESIITLKSWGVIGDEEDDIVEDIRVGVDNVFIL